MADIVERLRKCVCETGATSNVIRDAIAEIERLRAGAGWRPIETEPEAGAYLVANAKGEVCPVRNYGAGRSVVSNMPGFKDWTFGERATHWMHFPAPPEGEGNA